MRAYRGPDHALRLRRAGGQAIAGDTREGLEQSRHLVRGDTDPGVTHVNTHADVTATEEDTATWLRVLDGVAENRTRPSRRP